MDLSGAYRRSFDVALPVLAFVVSYGLCRLRLELRISEKRVAARAWPSPWTVVSIDQVLGSEVVQINPFREYGGWGIKGTVQDRLIGGRGTRALRVTYTHASGEERKLTFLTDRAEQAQQRITWERANRETLERLRTPDPRL